MASLWQETIDLPNFPSLKENIKTTAAVVGGGMAGILTAYFLKKKGIPCIVLEKDRIGHGTTGNTTAKITSQHGLIFHKLIKSSGEEAAKAYLLANEIAVEKFRELCALTGCNIETKNNYIYTLDDISLLERELDALSKIGAKAEYVRSLQLPFETAGAVMFRNQAQLHPLEFISAISRELDIYENTPVKKYSPGKLETDCYTVEAEHIIVTTHFPFINNHGLFSLKLYQHRSYVLALENAEIPDGMYLEDGKKGLSFRHYKNLLLMGGGDHRTGKKGGSYPLLQRLASEYFPEAEEKYRWAAQDCMSLDNIPYIGRYSPKTTGLYTATGFCKWGMTGSMVSAMLLSELICQGKSGFSSLFDPSRSMLSPQLFINVAEALMSFAAPTSRRCSHLGCALKYNKAEHSWDCPCHGSRFDENKKILEGPALNENKREET